MIKTNLHRVRNAIRFLNSEQYNIWMLVGHSTDWPDELNPPSPSVTDTSLGDVIGAVKCTLQWVIPDPAGAIQLIGPSGLERWTAYTTEVDAMAANCRWVMVTGQLTGTVIPVTPFRQIGFFSGLVPAVGHESATVLTVADIQSVGNMESEENRQVVYRGSSSMYTMMNIFEF